MAFIDGESGVPKNIKFDYQILSVPTFDEAGIPRQLGRFWFVSPKARIGHWIKRGEPLLEVEYPVFSREKKPGWFRQIFWNDPDPWWYFKCTLISPVSGLILGMREEIVSELIAWGRLRSIHTEILPVILIPKNEPPAEDWRLDFFEQIGTHLKNYWPRTPICHIDKGNIRLKEFVTNSSECWDLAISAIKKFQKPNLDKFPVRSISSSDEKLLNTVQDLRAYDSMLRDKLLHLDKLF